MYSLRLPGLTSVVLDEVDDCDLSMVFAETTRSSCCETAFDDDDDAADSFAAGVAVVADGFASGRVRGVAVCIVRCG
jgi:hypothetical protein